MKKYKIEYTRNGKDSTVIRRAESAEAAVDKLAAQYGWRVKLNMYDAATRGEEWAQVAVDPDGGINYSFAALASLAE